MGDGVDYTFNWFYIDAHDIGYQHSCKCPQRAQGVDPYLPTLGQRAVGLAGLHPARGAAVRSESGRGLPHVVEQQAGAAVHAERPRVLLRPGLPRARCSTSASRPRSPPGRRPHRRDRRDGGRAARSTCAARRTCRCCSQVMGADGARRARRARAGHARPARRVGSDARRIAATSTTTARTTIRSRRRSWTRGGRGSRTRCSTPASGNAIDALGIGAPRRDRRGHTARRSTAAFYSQVNKDLRQVLGQPVQRPVVARPTAATATSPPADGALERARAGGRRSRSGVRQPERRRLEARDRRRGRAAHRRSASRRCPRSTGSTGRRSSRSCSSSPARAAATPAAGCHAPAVPRRRAARRSGTHARHEGPPAVEVGEGQRDQPRAEFGNPLVDDRLPALPLRRRSTRCSRTRARRPAAAATRRARGRAGARTRPASATSIATSRPTASSSSRCAPASPARRKIVLKGRGADLKTPALPISHLPVKVQLINSASACWTATYGTTLKNETGTFKAKSD